MAQPGLPGTQKTIRLSLKHLAHIGLIGLPNAGKSTLLSRLTMARPRIENYPFSTLVPNLGVLSFEDGKTLTIADIPGLIEGASMGRGLGQRFLKHIERTRLLLHLIDITFVPGQGDLLEDFLTLRAELEKYDPALVRKEQLVVINKMDLYGPECRDVEAVRRALKELSLESLVISAATGQGLEALKQKLLEKFHDEEEGQ